MAVKLGEYILEKRIGKGGMGQVFLAKQESLDRQVAVKILPKELAKDDTFRARFEREAKSAASLIHPNVIQVYSFGIEKGVPYFAMEYVEGEDLAVQLRRGQKFSISDSVRIVRDVAKALECAHRKGMVHRDIKPSNMMVAPDETIKVMDFGLAKAAKVRTSITQKGLIVGTPPYMSPEQGKGDELDVRSDLYSVGVVFYELLTGTVPFHADTPTAVIYQHIYETPRPMREIDSDIPQALEDIVMKLLEKNPDERYADPTVLLADLDAFETGVAPTASIQAATAPPAASAYPKTLEIDASVTPVPTAAREPGISKVLLAGIAGGIVAAVVLIILLLTVWTREPPPPVVVINPDTPGPETPETPPDTQIPPDTTPKEKKKGLLMLSALRAALPDDVRTVYIREAGEEREKARGLPFEDIPVPVGMHVLRFERRGYRPQELGVEVTEIDNAPRLDEVKINFDLTSELADAYMRGKELAQQEKYSEALPELRRVETEIPHYEDIDELIALCSRHLARGKELDKKFNEAMKHFRDGNWEKVVELLSQLPEDYEKSSQAFGVLADARDKLKAEQRLQKLLLDAQDGLLSGDLARAESSAKAALAIDGANETANNVFATVVRARELLDAAAKAQEREDYESAAGKLRELVKLSPRSQKDKELLAKMERAHKETIARRQKITSLLDEASFALKAENPEDAISKLRNLLDNLDPNNTRAKVLLAKAHNLLTRKIITARLEMFDSYFAQGKASKLAEVIDPEQSNLRSRVAREMRDFCKENIRIVSAGHTGLNIMLDRDSASVDAVFKYEIELAEAKRTLSGSLKRRIKLVRRADTWYIAAVENLD